jgi:hypothetical protein
MNSTSEAPCIAIVGPANAGKTTLLHQLDEKLNRLDSFLVLKGNPDGTGRYLYHAPELRNDPEFTKSVKGKWGDATIERICEWITHGRRNLSLALLDFGGRHDEQTAEGNARMLDVCSHYLVVSRDNDMALIRKGRLHGSVRTEFCRICTESEFSSSGHLQNLCDVRRRIEQFWRQYFAAAGAVIGPGDYSRAIPQFDE